MVRFGWSVPLLAVVLVAAPVWAVGYMAPVEWAPGATAGFFPADVLDQTAECEGGLSAGFAERMIVPGDYDAATGEWDLWMEPYTDANGNGRYDPPDPVGAKLDGEAFVDENLNGKWDGPWMAGYGRDDDYWVAEGVRDPVWARAVALTCGDLRLGLVSVDAVGLFQDQVWAIRDAVADRFDHVVVAATHTHNSFDTMGLWGANLLTDGKSPEIMAYIRGQAADALSEASASAVPVGVKAGRTNSQRADIVSGAGYVQTDLRDPFAIDDALWALAFEDDAGVRGTLVNWSPHPETMAGTESLISSDYVHGLREAVEATGATVGGVRHEAVGGTSVFFSGAVGGMMTTLGAKVLGEDGAEVLGYAPRMDRIGEVAGWATLDAIASGETRQVDGMRVQVRDVTFVMDNPFLAALNTIGVLDHPVAIGPVTVGDPTLGSTVTAPVPMIRTELNVITLTAGGEPFVQIVTYPGEALPELHVGGHLETGHGDARPFECYAYDSFKALVNNGRQRNYNPTAPGADLDDPATWPKEDGWKRTLSAHPDIPLEPTIRDRMAAPYTLALGLANDELGYIIPASDYITATLTGPYGEGRDRCADDDHYEETVSAGSLMAPTITNNLAHMLDAGFVPEGHPLNPAGAWGTADLGATLDGEGVGVWIDSSGDNSYSSEEDTHVRVALPSALSGAWGWLDYDGVDQGATPDDATRGFWIDFDGDESYTAGRDGVVFLDHWAIDG